MAFYHRQLHALGLDETAELANVRKKYRGEQILSDHDIRPDVAAFLEFSNNQPGPLMHELSAPEAREMMRVMGQMADVEVGDLAVIRDIKIPGPAGDIPARIFDTRETRGAGPVLVFYHGGGFVVGDLDTYAPYCAETARQLDMPVISIDYRMGPEAPFPAATDDCEAATRWIAGSPAELGYDVTGLVTSGDSAGGNLTIVTTMALRDNPADVPVLLQFAIYPVVSSHPDWPSMQEFSDGFLLTADSMDWFASGYQADMSDWRAAPLDFDQAGMPPSVITTASLDPLRDQGQAYYEKLKDAGAKAEYYCAEGTIHGFIQLRKAIPSGNADITAQFDLVKKLLAEIQADA